MLKKNAKMYNITDKDQSDILFELILIVFI